MTRRRIVFFSCLLLMTAMMFAQVFADEQDVTDPAATNPDIIAGQDGQDPTTGQDVQEPTTGQDVQEPTTGQDGQDPTTGQDVQEPTMPEPGLITVWVNGDPIDLQVDYSGKSDASAILNRALYIAYNSSTNGQAFVMVPAGTYRLDGQVRIYSNTTLIAATGESEAEYARFIGNWDSDGTMVKGVHEHNGQLCRAEESGASSSDKSTCKQAGGGYTQLHNITIIGGIWDANGNTGNRSKLDTQALMLRHGENITLKDAIFQHATNHTVNISGCKDVTVSNCVFRDNVKYTGNSSTFWDGNKDQTRFRSLEALHMDFLASGTGSAIPADDTPCCNVTVSDCTFSNVWAGLGTHHINKNKRASNVSVKNCTFENLRSGGSTNTSYGGPAVYFNSADGLTVTQCTVTTAGYLASLEDCTNVLIRKSKIRNATENGLYLLGAASGSAGKKTVVDSCTFASPKRSGMHIKGKIKVELKGTNKITSPCSATDDKSLYGLTILNGASVTGTCPTITGSKNGGILIQKKGSANLTGGKVTSAKANGITIKEKGSKGTFKNLTVSTCGAFGAYVEKSASLTLNGGTFTSNKRVAVRVDGAKALISKVKVLKNKGKPAAIYLTKPLKNSKVTGCTVKDSKYKGISIEDAPKAYITNNKVSGCKDSGIQIRGKSKTCTVTISGNTSINKALKGKKNGKYDIACVDKCKKCIVKKNTTGKAGIGGGAPKKQIKKSGNKIKK